MDLGRERGDDKGIPHDLEKEMMAQGLDKSGIANYVPSQRLEWKRYKQYTRSDIMAAIEEVKSGKVFLTVIRSGLRNYIFFRRFPFFFLVSYYIFF